MKRRWLLVSVFACLLTGCADKSKTQDAAVSAGQGGGSGFGAGTGASDAASDSDSSTNGACEPGTSETQWATNCATTTAKCKEGTWTDPGSTTNDPLQCESAHFAVHSPNGTITQKQCIDATTQLETVIWPSYFGSPILFPEPYCDSTEKHNRSRVADGAVAVLGERHVRTQCIHRLSVFSVSCRLRRRRRQPSRRKCRRWVRSRRQRGHR